MLNAPGVWSSGCCRRLRAVILRREGRQLLARDPRVPNVVHAHKIRRAAELTDARRTKPQHEENVEANNIAELQHRVRHRDDKNTHRRKGRRAEDGPQEAEAATDGQQRETRVLGGDIGHVQNENDKVSRHKHRIKQPRGR